MIVYRHNLLWKRLRAKIGTNEIEPLKLLGWFLVFFFIISFFGMRLLNSLEEGYQAENRLQLLYQQVNELENENRILRKENEAIASESETESLYRSLGYKKPGEAIYLIEKPNPTVLPTPASGQYDKENTARSNWQTWFMLLFGE
jgi:cell division protein FtsB